MDGYVSSGTEYNCNVDSVACNGFFTNVTSQNGYPPVYVVPFNTGALNVVTEVPLASLPPGNPTAYAFASVGTSESRDEDVLAVEYAVFGDPGWNISVNSTNSVDVTNGSNVWNSKVASGQYYLTLVARPERFEGLFATALVGN